MSALSSRPLALRFVLHGSRLIEASAGTGKTFTISALYLRLVLGHGGDAGFERELLPPEILVVTFTDAATRELRDRIRARLVEAALVFRDEAKDDELLAQLRDDFDPELWPACARRLDIAAQWMDEAAVSTIHGWCQRMLREHAFDSGSLFTQTLQTDHSELLALVVRDYWRQHCYPLAGEALDWVISHWKTPDTLLGELRPLLQEPGEANEPLSALLDEQLQARARAWVDLKAPWLNWADELESVLMAAVTAKQVDGRKLQARYIKSWCDKLRDWARGDETALDLGTGFTRLTPDGLFEAWKVGEPPTHPALEAMVTLPAQLDALSAPLEAARRHAAAWVSRRFDEEKRRRAEMGFDDMLSRLDDALQGENGDRLAEVIRGQFPVALIDEFQDTDPLQYRIFDRIYRLAENHKSCGLFLIGDPKQAIYAFRGADIHTYLSARQSTSGRHDSLDTNFRSATAMVSAVNRMFELAEQRDGGKGAFLFRSGADNPLPFMPVKAKGRKEQWYVNKNKKGHPSAAGQPALTFWQLEQDEPVSGTAYREQMAASAATKITELLNLGRKNQAGFAGDEGFTALQPSDIAVLVRDFREAEAIRTALAGRGVRSVYLSDKDSIFDSQEARDLLLWLRACAEPEQDRLLRAALASRSLGLTLNELEQLNQDERSWERRVMQFRDYRSRWRRQGVLPMVHQLLHDFALPGRLMQRADGERALTNLLHLTELMQQAAATLDGEQALTRHLAELLGGEGLAADEQVLRLESDAALVRVVTIHKSKGLEYPLVFLPFICSFKAQKKGRAVQLHDGERRRLVLTPNEDQLALADRERLGEDLRLLYVALTRARHACWLGMADIKVGNGKSSRLHDSALGYLLGAGVPLPNSQALADWLGPLAMVGEIELTPAPEPSAQPLQGKEEAATEPHWRTPARPAAEHWWIASYSALRTGEPSAARPTRRFEDAAPESPAASTVADDERESVFMPLRPGETPTMHRFPRGPNPGTFLHGLLELAGREGFDADSPALADQLARRCQLRGLTEWIAPLGDWLRQLLNTPLSDEKSDEKADEKGDEVGEDEPEMTAPILAGLSAFQPELEFWLEVSRVDVRRIDAQVQAAVLPGQPRAELLPDTLNGMFKGFIDLVFEHQGRYFVVDYKSNWLGNDEAAYTRGAMEEQVLKHRYDLQYVLYLLALHRQLKLRLPDYDYDTHMGGALYLFVRHPQAVYQDRPPRELIETLDALFTGDESTGEEATGQPDEESSNESA
ncbi:exodeoxyribonuclease V subunit beta [Oceanisphaera arctica]|uniref:RecBCD enzyme subunit RecB n=1 Tax=Oceanisphaera arctica TaxID=641510 RepID=A0A2P5TID5_9GAMM|nr:exodeoxyribonuclease V subunit beta [Oceanisphaera arctica]PPL14482.1 exodeoxyribonuclease V subunit beta [Oceanisphaera arctica]GHA10286.1 RecBCD enzyme subunit RecB [Oceanisphaera arctica]